MATAGADAERDQSSCATEASRHILASPGVEKQGASKEGGEQGVGTESDGTASPKIPVETKRRKSTTAVISNVDGDVNISGQEIDQNRLGLDGSAAPGGSGVSLPAMTGGHRGKEKGLSDAAAATASTGLGIGDHRDRYYNSSGSESESVSGGESSDEADVSIGGSEIDEDEVKTASEITACGSDGKASGQAWGGPERKKVANISMYQPLLSSGDKDGGVSGAGVQVFDRGTSGSGLGVFQEETSDYRSAETHDRRPKKNVEIHPGGEDSEESDDIDSNPSRRGGELSSIPFRSASECHIDLPDHDGPVSTVTADLPRDIRCFSERPIMKQRTSKSPPTNGGVRRRANIVTMVGGVTTTEEGACLFQSSSPEVNVSGLRAGTFPNSHGEIVTNVGPPACDGSDSGMEWEEEGCNREDDGAAYLGCGEMSKDGSGIDSAVELPGPLDVQPLFDIHPAGPGVTQEVRCSASEEQPLLVNAAGISNDRQVSVRVPLDFTTAASSSAADNHEPKAIGKLLSFTSVPTSSPPPMPSGSRKAYSDSGRPGADASAAIGAEISAWVVEHPLQKPVKESTRSDVGLVAVDLRQRLPDPPVMEPRMHTPRNEPLLGNQEAKLGGDTSGVGKGGEVKDDTKLLDPDVQKNSCTKKVRRGLGGPDSVMDTKCSMHMINSTSTTYANASHQTLVAAPQGHQSRNGLALSQLYESSVGASHGTSYGGSKGSRFEASSGIQARNFTATCGTSRSGDNRGRFVGCFPRLAAILTAYHNGRALTRYFGEYCA